LISKNRVAASAANRHNDPIMNGEASLNNTDYDLIAAAIRFIDAHASEQPSLELVAARLHVSPFHFQRVFRRWAGISPKRFLEFLTLEHAKDALARSKSVLETSLEVGLSSPARLHDHFVTLEGVTPGEFKQRGSGLEIRYGFHPSPFGRMFLAATPRGVCGVAFVGKDGAMEALASLQRRWPNAAFVEDSQATSTVAEGMFAGSRRDGDPIHLTVRGTNFQISVWKALLDVPFGRVASYEQIAQAIGRPKAVRPVASAVADNPACYLIPCHRVIHNTGAIGQYRFGAERKRALIAWEAAIQRR